MVSIKQSKFIKSLKIKKYRTREKCFLVEGSKNVMEAITAEYVMRYLLVTADFLEKYDLPETLASSAIVVSPRELEELGTFTTNQDCLAVVEMPASEVVLTYQDHVVALDGVSDPGNLGTIIRTLDWFGFRTLVCSPDTADFYNPKVINSTMGSFTRVQVVYMELQEFIRQAPIPAYGADLAGVALSLWKPEEPVIVVMGSESHGLREEVAGALAGTVTIPRLGGAESLNVAIATSLFCNHLRS